MKETKTFTEGKILKPLVLFALPVLLALFLQAMYGAVDLLVVGKVASSVDVSAVSTGSQLMATITNLISSFTMGTTILLGQQIGSGKRKEGGTIRGNLYDLDYQQHFRHVVEASQPVSGPSPATSKPTLRLCMTAGLKPRPGASWIS